MVAGISETIRKSCRRCGAPLAGDELAGNCPRCLATLILSPETAEPAETSPTPVLRRLGDYELLEEVARGGMGVVFRARQVSLDREVAVKVLRDAWLATPTQVKRFQAEAANAAKLKHPNIVAVHEVGEQGGQHFFAMDLVQGANLAEATREGPLPPRRAAELVAKVAQAVQHAHQAGVLHRDLKPSNVLLDAQGEPHVTDFGLARPMDDESSLTLTGQILGTPGYIAPEQAKGRGAVGPAADVYGLGALLFHLLTARAPFVGASAAETLTQVLQQEPLSPRLLNPAVPVDLAAVCLKCLAKAPGHRYGSAQELADDLKRFLDGQNTRARPAGPVDRSVRWAKRKPALAATLVALLMVGLLGLGGIIWQWRRAEAESLKFQFRSYGADMNLASRALEDSDFGGTRELLNKHTPQKGGPDFRGWEWRYLSECIRSDEVRFLGRHSNSVSVVAFSPDGQLLASGGVDGVVRFWKTGSWESAGAWQVPGRVRTMAFSPDGKTLVTGTLNNQIIAWDRANQRGLFTNQWGFGNYGGILKFGSNGQELFAGGDAGRVATFDARTGEKGAEIRDGQMWVRALALSPDGQRLWIGTEDPSMTAWGTSDRKKLWSKFPHANYVSDLQCSPNGRIVASSGQDSVVRLWDAQDGSSVGELNGHHWDVDSLSFSPDGRWLASAGADQTIILWDVAKRSLAARFHGNDQEVLSVAFSPDGTSLVSGAKDGSVRVWPGAPSPTNANNANSAALPPGLLNGKLSRSGRYASLVYADGLQLMEIASGKVLGRRQDSLAAKFSPDETLILSKCRDGHAVCSVPELSVLKLLPRMPPDDFPCAAFSADGRIVALSNDAGEVRLLDWKSGKLLARCQLPDGVRSIVFGPHDATFATGGEEGSLRLWRTADAALVGAFAGHNKTVADLAFSADGARLVSASLDATARLWDVRTQRELQVFKGHRVSVMQALFSMDGRRLFTGGLDGEIRVWDVASAQLLLTLRAHPMQMRLALQPDDTLVSASFDGVRFWRAPGIPGTKPVASQ